MSKYTIDIYHLKQNNFNFGLDTYPIFDEDYRNGLNNRILNHFLLDEIGFETAQLFKVKLNLRMEEIMPYYNELYKLQKKFLEENDYTNNVNLTKTYTRKSDNQTNIDSKSDSTNENSTNTQTINNSNSNSNGKNLFQDTPQGNIVNLGIDQQTYATNLTLSKNGVEDHTNTNGVSSSNDKSNSNNFTKNISNGVEEYVEKLIGNNGQRYQIEILNDIKNSLLKIDLMIMDDLKDLFMQIY